MHGARAVGIAIGAVVVLAVSGCSGDGERADPPTTSPSVITVTSTAFGEGQPIPQKYTCDGDEVSPPLAWAGASDAKALALVVDDPDAPGGTYVHWVVANIDPGAVDVQEGQTPDTGVEVVNSSGDTSYAGPCPPSGTHHYRFTLYALNDRVDVTAESDLDGVFAAIDDAAIGHGTLTGTYEHQ